MMIKKALQLITFTITFTILLSSCNDSELKEAKQEASTEATNKVVLTSDIEWEQLNPARGDKSPLAGTLWGDRKANVATGYLGKFVDGFSSPPHIHNVSYRAIVIKGSLHNDDPAAASMWMEPGSFWTQPQGEAHITAAKGTENMAYIEIDNGPYLVLPTDEAFDNGERPVNIDASNVVWLGTDKSSYIDENSQAEISFLWQSKTVTGLQGLFVKLPEKYSGTIKSDGEVFYAVVIEGELNYHLPQKDQQTILDPGSCFSSQGTATHQIKAESDDSVVIYIRTNGKLLVGQH